MGRIDLTEDTGAVAVVVAVLVVVFVSVSVLVFDLGYMYDTRRQLQAAAEAGALAGCQELIASKDPGLADAEARAYATANSAGGPVGGSFTVERVDVDETEGSVRVVMADEAPALFGAFFGNDTYTVKAAAKARKWQLTGGRYLIPWAIPIIRHVDTVEALVTDKGGNVLASGELVDDGVRTYSGYVPLPDIPGAYQVRVRITNEYGIVERVVDSSDHEVASAGVMTAGDPWPFTSVTLSDDYIIAGDGAALPSLTVRTVAPQPGGVQVYIGSRGRTMVADASATRFTYQLTAADVDLESLDLMTVYPLDVRIGNETRGVDEAYLHVCRSTYPIDDVEVSPSAAGPGSSVGVTLRLSEFDPVHLVPGATYTLRVATPSGQVGNFGELNFDKILHSATCPADITEPDPGNRYAEWTAYGFPGGVHLWDIIEMSPGTSGVNTDKALDERMSFDPTMVVAVPVVEKYEDKGGAYNVIVVDFAAFHVTGYDKSGNVQGQFLRYTANPSSFSDDPGGDDNSIYAARLVNP